jgi:hypothetical protein
MVDFLFMWVQRHHCTGHYDSFAYPCGDTVVATPMRAGKTSASMLLGMHNPAIRF